MSGVMRYRQRKRPRSMWRWRGDVVTKKAAPPRTLTAAEVIAKLKARRST